MTTLARAGRLWRTARHLRPIQIFGRARFLLSRPTPDLSPPPPVRQTRGAWLGPAERRASLIGPTGFRFLNREADLAAVGWDDPEMAKLWRYNQHYFDDLTAENWRERTPWHRDLIARWIEGNPPGAGSGWEPYPTSLRIVNWIKWSLAGEALTNEAHASLAVQVRWLNRRLEWHLLGNHLFANAKALIFAGLYFESAEAEGWLRSGLAIIDSELDEQFLPDGAQFELSTMYHALGVEDLLDLLNVGAAFSGLVPTSLINRIELKASAAIAWLRIMSHPDGRISFFSDAAFGIAPGNEQLIAYATRLGLESKQVNDAAIHLGSSGYARLALGPAVLLADLADIGPDHLPAHAHADALSFELSLGEQRVFVNSGTSEYGVGPERLRQRGTAAHNTVVADGENSSEVWGGFRVGRRARIGGVHVESYGDSVVAEARHDGYVHTRGVGEHRRKFTLTAEGLQIEDALPGGQIVEAIYHLHPSVKVDGASPDSAQLLLPDGKRLRVLAKGGQLRLEAATWHPELGITVPSSRLVLPLDKGRAGLRLDWN